jgi:GT2 family glycosyltransferase
MVSLILLTIDRYELTKEIVSDTLHKANYPYELLICDNGSQDKRLIDYINILSPEVFVQNKINKGVAKMQNLLISQSKGDYICLIGNDIRMPHNWLSSIVDTYQAIPNSGIAGIHCVEKLYEPQTINNKLIHPGNVFATMLYSRNVLNKVGKICEDYHPYGLEDSDYNIRVNGSGFISYYLGGLQSIHEGSDMHLDTDYRKMKSDSLQNNSDKFNLNVKKYYETNNYYL